MVPKGQVQDVFVEICEFEKPQYDQTDTFLDYVTVTYVDPDDALFTKDMWNQYDDTDNKRSNKVT